MSYLSVRSIPAPQITQMELTDCYGNKHHFVHKYVVDNESYEFVFKDGNVIGRRCMNAVEKLYPQDVQFLNMYMIPYDQKDVMYTTTYVLTVDEHYCIPGSNGVYDNKDRSIVIVVPGQQIHPTYWYEIIDKKCQDHYASKNGGCTIKKVQAQVNDEPFETLSIPPTKLQIRYM